MPQNDDGRTRYAPPIPQQGYSNARYQSPLTDRPSIAIEAMSEGSDNARKPGHRFPPRVEHDIAVTPKLPANYRRYILVLSNDSPSVGVPHSPLPALLGQLLERVDWQRDGFLIG